MEKPGYSEEIMKQPRYSIKLPLEYSQADDGYRGGITVNLGEDGLLMRSIQNLSIHAEVNVRVFFPNEYELDGIRIIARVVRKEPYCEKDWKGYLYELDFIQKSIEDHRKLVTLLRSPSLLDGMITKEDGPSPGSVPERAKVPLLPDAHLKARNASRGTSLLGWLMKTALRLR
jgi:hypothetical protein